MAKLRLGPLADEKSIRLTVEVSAELHRSLQLYGQILGEETGTPAIEPIKLIPPMLARFMAADRAFASKRRA